MSPPTSARRAWPAFLLLLAVALAVAVYHPILANYFYADDFVLFYDLSNGQRPVEFILTPYGGHMYVTRNLVLYAMHGLFGTEPVPYFWTVLLTHAANVALLFTVIRLFTGSAGLAFVGAALWGTSPLNEGTLGWYNIYGQVLAGTILLGILYVCGRPAVEGRPLSGGALAATYALAVVGSSCFGVGLGIALATPRRPPGRAAPEGACQRDAGHDRAAGNRTPAAPPPACLPIDGQHASGVPPHRRHRQARSTRDRPPVDATPAHRLASVPADALALARAPRGPPGLRPPRGVGPSQPLARARAVAVRIRSRALALGSVALGYVLASGAAAAPRSPGGGLCATATARHGRSGVVAVLSAFPAELAPLVARAVVHERVDLDGHTVYVGELAGVRVVLALTGIGMLNAAATTERVLARFDVAAIVVSGVAGSPHRIGDVTVPEEWRERDAGSVFAANPALLHLARRLADGVALETCTPVPPPAGPTVCMAHTPAVVVGGVGHSDDPFGERPAPCQPGGGDVFGCELPEPSARAGGRQETIPEEPVAEDMETAAVARVAASHGVPWVAFRAVSDGAGDPLGLAVWQQFFAYYPLAAKNAAAGTLALLERVGRLGATRSPVCRPLARARWARAVRLLRGRAQAR